MDPLTLVAHVLLAVACLVIVSLGVTAMREPVRGTDDVPGPPR